MKIEEPLFIFAGGLSIGIAASTCDGTLLLDIIMLGFGIICLIIAGVEHREMEKKED